MGNRFASKTVQGPLLLLFGIVALAQPAAALNADYCGEDGERRSGTSRTSTTS